MDKENENCHRALMLLYEAGRHFCIALIKQKYESLDNYLANNRVYSKGRVLKEYGKLFTEQQHQLFFPPTDIEQWDLTFALCFLKYFTELSESEKSFVKEIKAKIVKIVEEYPQHTKTEHQFKETWKSLIRFFERSVKLLSNHTDKLKIEEVCATVENINITASDKEKIENCSLGENRDNEVDIDKFDLNKRYSLVHDAAYDGRLDTLQYIAGVFPNMLHQYDDDGNLAIHRAAEGGQLSCLGYLIDKGSDPYSKTRNQFDNIMYKAIKGKRCEIVKFICERYPAMVNEACWKYRPPIFAAAVLPSRDIITCLIKYGADIRTRDAKKCTVFHIAALEGSVSFLQAFEQVKLGELKIAKSEGGWSVCHHAANGGQLECLKLLVELGFDPTMVSDVGFTVLHTAAWRGYVNIMKYLCNTFPAMWATKSRYGLTALHSAAIGGSIECLQYLVNQGLSVSTRTNDGNTCLDLARRKGHIDMVRYLSRNFDLGQE